MNSMIGNSDSLGRSFEQFKQIVENLRDTIKIVDVQGRVIYASPSHKQVYGYDAGEYIGKEVFADVYPEDLSNFKSAFGDVLNKKESIFAEIRKYHRDGHSIWLEASCSPVIDANGDIQNVIIVTRDISERKDYEEKLEYMAYHDFLTGLYNRRKFKQLFEQSLEQAEEQNLKLAVLMMDLNHFKWINDQLGHDAGDTMLQEVSKRIMSCKREGDLVGRLSGDEFAILMPALKSEAEIVECRERITAALKEPCVLNEGKHRISASIGVALFPEHGRSVSQLMKAADVALYKAKRKGNQAIASMRI